VTWGEKAAVTVVGKYFVMRRGDAADGKAGVTVAGELVGTAEPGAMGAISSSSVLDRGFDLVCLGFGILTVDVDADADGDVGSLAAWGIVDETVGEASWSSLVNAAAIIALMDSHLGVLSSVLRNGIPKYCWCTVGPGLMVSW